MDFEKYLQLNAYNWKDFFIFLIDDGKMQELIENMIEEGFLQEMDINNIKEFVIFLEKKFRENM